MGQRVHTDVRGETLGWKCFQEITWLMNVYVWHFAENRDVVQILRQKERQKLGQNFKKRKKKETKEKEKKNAQK